MKVLSPAQMKELDQYTIAHEPISSLNLMERAAEAMVKAITSRWSSKHPVKVFAGPGNNGGDALAVARLLAKQDYLVEVFLFNTSGKLSPDCLANKDRIVASKKLTFNEITSQFNPPELTSEMLVVDGLFGNGLNKPLSGGFASVVKYINASPATVISLDLPSGLMSLDNTYNIPAHIVKATVTLTLQLPKLSFFFAENQVYLGEWVVLDIGLHPQGLEEILADYTITEHAEMRKLLHKRQKFAHKGDMGHALLVAGKYGMCGAAILAAKACLRSGVGKITVHTPIRNNAMLQLAVPEAIMDHDKHDSYTTYIHKPEIYQAVAVGPGIGLQKDTAIAFLEMMHGMHCPLVIDADALNILGEHRGWMAQVPTLSILTPHVKEMERLVGNCVSSYERLMKAKELAEQRQLYIILKGAWTAVITPEGRITLNPTGNPGMATAGSGDVLTGILLGLLAQGYKHEEACRLGVYLHGLAGDLAAKDLGEECLTASDIISYLPHAFKKLKETE